PPARAAMPYAPIPSQERAERHGIAYQEDPHPEFSPTLRSQGAFVGLRMPGMHCSSFAHCMLSFWVQARLLLPRLWARLYVRYTVPKIEPKIANGINIRKRILIFKPRARASSPSKQTAQAQAATGRKASTAVPPPMPRPLWYMLPPRMLCPSHQ